MVKTVSPVLPLRSHWHSRHSAPSWTCQIQLCPLAPESRAQTHLGPAWLVHRQAAVSTCGLGRPLKAAKEVKGSLQHESTLMLWLCTLIKLIYNTAVPDKKSSGYY